MDEHAARQLSFLLEDVGRLVERFEAAQPTLRQRYAMAAMTGLFAQTQFARQPAKFARQAFVYADAMLQAEFGAKDGHRRSQQDDI